MNESVEQSVRASMSDAEWTLRCELAAAHRLAHFINVGLTYNHISARVPGEPNHFLVKAEALFMSRSPRPTSGVCRAGANPPRTP